MSLPSYLFISGRSRSLFLSTSDNAFSSSVKSMASKLAAEILAAAKEEGAAVKKRTDTHKMAEANKAFSHFRF